METTWNGRSKRTSETDCIWLVMWICADRLRGLVLQDEVSAAGERPALREDVDIGIDGDDLGLRQILVFLEVALVVGLDVAPVLGGEILVQHVGVVVIPGAASDGDQQEDRRGRDKPRRALPTRAGSARDQPSSAPRRASAIESVARRHEMESQ